jgi:spore coat protein H
MLPAFSNLSTRIIFNPPLRERLVATVDRALGEVFTEEQLRERVEESWALLDPHMREDPRISQERWRDSLRFMREFHRLRIGFVKEALERYRTMKPGLAISALDAAEGWLELTNYGERAVSTGGLVLTTNLRRALTPNVPARSMAPGETVRFSDAALGLNLEAEGELGLYDGVSVVGPLDVFFYGKLPAGQFYERRAGSPERWGISSR